VLFGKIIHGFSYDSAAKYMTDYYTKKIKKEEAI